ncbi:zinc-ribbon domain-containing protein [Pinisolibacter aquiterrae]|uniref:zinc-ribbon domain-containing protein n=1 Tax=Pinisolibacter aquiterrae TaxID=2815579 RepID=UPI001C3D75CD|nr:zinc-ribbon domain-containing protein [Pinisolibacter aquiterrae]MBV5263845.1 zinc-ribbon domain-containing protein [Pinisolibacter aquiterrae]MCC8237347.1 zinc-ribbon domain-containing protein [Pinisolibacter aquiterrae]
MTSHPQPSMRLFSCDACSNPIHFDNSTFVACHAAIGIVAETGAMTSLVPNGTHWHAPARGRDVALCANAVYGACNGLAPVERAGDLCPVRRHSRTIPDLSIATNIAKFRRIVGAERHLFHSLGRWSLAPATKAENASTGSPSTFSPTRSRPRAASFRC